MGKKSPQDNRENKKNNMKILISMTTIDNGGAENYLIKLIKSIANDGHRISVIYMQGKNFYHDELTAIGVKILPPKDELPKTKSIIKFFKSLNHMRVQLKGKKFDLLISNLQPMELGMMVLSPFYSADRKVLVRHNDEEFYGKYLKRLYIKFYDTYIAISKVVKERLVNEGVEKNKVKLCYYGISKDLYKKYPLNNNKKFKRVICVARHEEQKNLFFLIDEFSKYLKKNKSDIFLDLVGDGTLSKALKRYVKKHGLDSNVVFHGKVTNPFPLIVKSNALVLTSHYEGLGLVLLESVSLKIPVLCPDMKPCNEFISKDQGFLYEINSSSSFQKNLSNILKSNVTPIIPSNFELQESLKTWKVALGIYR